MIVYVHNEVTNKIEKYTRSLDQDMPYTTLKHLTVREFLGKNRSRIIWSSKAFLESFENAFDHGTYKFIVKNGFYRGWQLVENGMYVHKLGTATLGAEQISSPKKISLVKILEASNRFTKVGQIDLVPSCIYMNQSFEHVNGVVPFPKLKIDDIGVAVFVLQDNLWALGYAIPALTGVFDETLDYFVRKFQVDNNLIVDGIVGSKTWTTILKLIHPDDNRLDAILY